MSIPFSLVKSDNPFTPGSWRSMNITFGAGPCSAFQVLTRRCTVRSTLGYRPGYCSSSYSNNVVGFSLGSRLSIGSSSLAQTAASGSRLTVCVCTSPRLERWLPASMRWPVRSDISAIDDDVTWVNPSSLAFIYALFWYKWMASGTGYSSL